MSESKKCCKCGEEMEKGKCLVHRYWPPDHEIHYVPIINDSSRIKITPYRCKKCGHVELYTEVETDETSESEHNEQTEKREFKTLTDYKLEGVEI